TQITQIKQIKLGSDEPRIKATANLVFSAFRLICFICAPGLISALSAQSAFRLICVICVICGPGVSVFGPGISVSVLSAQSVLVLRDQLLVAEDTRPVTDTQIAILREALNGSLRRTAIRSIWRIDGAQRIPL